MTIDQSALTVSTPIDILEAYNIVFSQIIAALDLDHDQINDPWVFQAMLVPGRNKGGLVSVEHELAIVVENAGHAGYHDPVLAAVMMHLQR